MTALLGTSVRRGAAPRFDHEAAVAEYEMMMNAGMPGAIASLARRHGVSQASMSNVLKRAGVRRGSDLPGRGGLVDREEFAAMWRARRTTAALARLLGCERCSVYARANRLGLSRSRSQASADHRP
jgi:hypothetical protein